MKQVTEYPVSIRFSHRSRKLYLSPELKLVPRKENMLLREFLGRLRKLKRKKGLLCFLRNPGDEVRRKHLDALLTEFKPRLSLSFRVVDRCPVKSKFSIQSIHFVFVFHFAVLKLIRLIEVPLDNPADIKDREVYAEGSHAKRNSGYADRKSLT